MRVTASLSGWMLKLPIVWWMSCDQIFVRKKVIKRFQKAYCRGILIEQHFDGLDLMVPFLRRAFSMRVTYE